MEKKAIDAYKKRIASLSKEEQKKHLIHLKELAEGTKLGCMTGYSSLDKIWLKWYDKEKIAASVDAIEKNEISIFDYFLRETENFPEAQLIEYYGKTYTRNEIKLEVEKVMDTFRKMGLQKGDAISLLLLNTPEAMFLYYAALHMGITANLIKFDESSERIREMTENTKSKCFFCVSIPDVLERVKEAFQNNQYLEQVIVISVTESLNNEQIKQMTYEDFIINRQIEIKKEQKAYNPNQIEERKMFEKYLEKLVQDQYAMDAMVNHLDGFETYHNWQQNPQEIQNKIPSFEEGKGIIVYTGGSTGAPKGVQLSDKKLNCVADVWKYGDHGMDLGKTAINILPPAIAYHFQATHASISRGVKVSLISLFASPEQYPYLVQKYRPNIQFGGPILYENIRKSNILEDVSFMELPISGGDKMSDEEEEKNNEYIKNNGGTATILQGYGMSEGGACTSVSKKECYKVGSIGIPFINQTVGIFEYRTDTEVTEKQIGEICVTGPTLMEGYLNNQEETDYVLMKHSDGLYWLHTDDLGFMDEEGRLYHRGRAKRMLTRSGVKIWVTEIERIATAHPDIEKCCAVKASDEMEREVPVLHIVLNEQTTKSIEEITKELDEMLKKTLGNGYVPRNYIIRKELPYSEVNKKCDFKALEQEDLTNKNDYYQNGNIIYKNYDVIRQRKQN